jgi:hypothetical protein
MGPAKYGDNKWPASVATLVESVFRVKVGASGGLLLGVSAAVLLAVIVGALVGVSVGVLVGVWVAGLVGVGVGVCGGEKQR